MIGLIATLALAMMNPTCSPDSSKIAFTRGNDLYVKDAVSEKETRITFDGSDTILNGYASWVYYEEIFGRASEYRAFWWSPDSKKIAFYRFDNTGVGEFPVFSPKGQYGSTSVTRYPKAGSRNPSVRIGIADVSGGNVTWAAFDENPDQYFGTPFWSGDGTSLYVQWEPRRQNELKLYRVSAFTGKKEQLYEDHYMSWVNFISGMLFTSKGLYMVRDSQTGWEQIWFLSYDGKRRMVTEGRNWDIRLLRCDEKSGRVWFLSKRDSPLHPTLYCLSGKKITALTDPSYWVKDVKFSDDGNSFTALMSTAAVPWKRIEGSSVKGWETSVRITGEETADIPADRPSPEIVKIKNGKYDLYGLISYPKNFSMFRKYPVVMQLYGGPGTPYVRDRWADRDASDEWCYRNGIIYIVVDPRSSGENGRAGMDESYGRMTVVELEDYIAWAKWLQTKDFVDAEHIGVEGFSFGGTTTAMLVLRYPEYFCCGIAGGGVYDWTLYDTHYTERFMNTPQINPDGYVQASVLQAVRRGGVSASYRPGALKLTHGTGDDNVHLQNTLLLADALQECGTVFELMLYPDGGHGYRDYQGRHSRISDHDFWKKHLFAKSK